MKRLLAIAALAASVMQGPGHPGQADLRPIAPAFQPIQQHPSPQPVMLAAMAYGDGVTRLPGAPVRTGW